MAKVAVIGSGMAGLSALQQLAEQGHDVTIFEKSRGSGGRLATKKVDTASWDMGAQFIKANTPAFANQLNRWHQAGWIMPWDITPWVLTHNEEKPSPDDALRYVAVPRMTALSRQLLKPATEFVTQTRITHCRYENRQWHLEDEHQQLHGDFDALVIAIPPLQAAPLLQQSPALANACTVEMMPCWTLLLALDSSLDKPWDAAFVKDSPIAWLARNSSKPQRDQQETWVIQASHSWSQQRCDDSRSRVQDSLLKEFQRLTGMQPEHLTAHWLHRWLYAIPHHPNTIGFLFDPDRSLAVCGDWLKDSNVEGAWLSGSEAGQAVCQHLQQS